VFDIAVLLQHRHNAPSHRPSKFQTLLIMIMWHYRWIFSSLNFFCVEGCPSGSFELKFKAKFGTFTVHEKSEMTGLLAPLPC